MPRLSPHALSRALLSPLGAFFAALASPLLIGHFCELTSPFVEGILIAGLPVCSGVAIWCLPKPWHRVVALPGAPALNFVATQAYLEWLHSDAFPSFLLG